jgi:hypothetical protein
MRKHSSETQFKRGDECEGNPGRQICHLLPIARAPTPADPDYAPLGQRSSVKTNTRAFLLSNI